VSATLLVGEKCYLNILVIKLIIVESTAGVTVNSLGECGSFWLETPVTQSNNVYIYLIIRKIIVKSTVGVKVNSLG
jgi:hypothetical protein